MQDTFSPQPFEEQPKAFSPSQENQPSQTNGTATHRSLTLSSKEMPQWLRWELEAGKSQEIEEVVTTPEGTVRQSHEKLASTGPQMTTLRHQLSSMQERQFTMQRERGGCLTAWLVFVGIANALALIFGLVMTSTWGPFSLLYVVDGALALIGVVGTWRQKKWGYYTLLAFYIISVVASLLVISSSVTPFIGSLIGLCITSVLVLDKWEDFE